MTIKKQLAFEITKELTNLEEAEAAKESFEKRVQGGEKPEEIKEITLKKSELSILEILSETKLASSNSEAKRLLEQGGVSVDSKQIKNPNEQISLKDNLYVHTWCLKNYHRTNHICYNYFFTMAERDDWHSIHPDFFDNPLVHNNETDFGVVLIGEEEGRRWRESLGDVAPEFSQLAEAGLGAVYAGIRNSTSGDFGAMAERALSYPLIEPSYPWSLTRDINDVGILFLTKDASFSGGLTLLKVAKAATALQASTTPLIDEDRQGSAPPYRLYTYEIPLELSPNSETSIAMRYKRYNVTRYVTGQEAAHYDPPDLLQFSRLSVSPAQGEGSNNNEFANVYFRKASGKSRQVAVKMESGKIDGRFGYSSVGKMSASAVLDRWVGDIVKATRQR